MFERGQEVQHLRSLKLYAIKDADTQAMQIVNVC